MKRRIRDLMLLLGGVAIIGAVVVVSGTIPVHASWGHIPGVAWLLQFASGRSIATYSVGIEVPPLKDPELVRLGAVAYQSNCQWCHGGPSEPSPVVAANMLPPPPYLPAVVGQWKPEELFTIVKHGIKFAGMPAWPTQERDEEVWAVVAFLIQFPGLERSQYEKLLELDTIAPSPSSQASSDEGSQTPPIPDSEMTAWKRCQLCHGHADGLPVHELVPVLAGQSAEYLRHAMQAYASGARPSGIMQPIASRLTNREIEQWVAYYTIRPINDHNKLQLGPLETTLSRPSADRQETGKELVFDGKPRSKIPACVDCHGPAPEPQRMDYPILAGQSSAYVVRQLELFTSGVRRGPRSEVMRIIAQQLSHDQRRAVAEFYQQSFR